jgi:hypothetical protein
MGIMITLANPTGPMLSEAASAGFVCNTERGPPRPASSILAAGS